MNYLKRQRRLIRLLESNSLDGLLVRKKQNIAYLTGTSGEGTMFLISHKKSYLVKNGAIPAHLKKIRSKKGIVESLRIVKDSDELRCIKKACKDGCDIMNYAIKCIAPGITERAVKNKVEQYIIKKGKQRADFDIIIASGRNASNPHAAPMSKKIKEKEMVVIDLGAMNYGYNSDLTRTVFLGRIDRKCLRIYNIVLAAQKKAIERVRPGIKANYIDNISRQYISKKGLARYFIHGLGHGIGLEVHEGPSISKNSNITLKENMVITVEPGIYMTGWGGIRIEDVVLVTKNGCKVLTSGCKK